MKKLDLFAVLWVAVIIGGISFAIFANTHEWGWLRYLNPIGVGFVVCVIAFTWGKV